MLLHHATTNCNLPPCNYVTAPSVTTASRPQIFFNFQLSNFHMSYHLPSIPREKHESYFHITHTVRPGVLLYFFIVLYYYTLTYNVIYSCIILYHIRHINTPSLISVATSSLLFVRNSQSLVSYRFGIDKQEQCPRLDQPFHLLSK